MLAVWDFVGMFGPEIGLSAFTPDELCAALFHPGDSLLLTELHMQLLRLVLDGAGPANPKSVSGERPGPGRFWAPLAVSQLPPPADDSVTPSTLQQLPSSAALLGPANWPEVLRCVCWLLPELQQSLGCTAALLRLQECGYSDLDGSDRLVLLRALCDTCLSTETLEQVAHSPYRPVFLPSPLSLLNPAPLAVTLSYRFPALSPPPSLCAPHRRLRARVQWVQWRSSSRPPHPSRSTNHPPIAGDA